MPEQCTTQHLSWSLSYNLMSFEIKYAWPNLTISIVINNDTGIILDKINNHEPKLIKKFYPTFSL
jgi:hypothetical protein